MRKLRIEYDSAKCIGNKNCEIADPSHFKVPASKAILIGGSRIGSSFELIFDSDDESKKRAINAALNCPVNAIKVIDANTEEEIVSDKVRVEDGVKKVIAEYDDMKEFVLDPKGYFLIRTLPATKEIEVGFCGARNKVELIVTGKKPIEIYQTLHKHGVISRMDHASYIGRELQKAYDSLILNIPYIQDDELKI